MKPVTAVVPLVAAHDRYLPELLTRLEAESLLLQEVIVARSGQPTLSSQAVGGGLRDAVDATSFPVRLLPTRRRQTAGENRNRGAAEAKTPFIAFMDADDLYAPKRLGIMLSVALKHESNLVLHDFGGTEAELSVLHEEPLEGLSVIGTDELYDATFAAGRNRKLEGSTPGDTNLYLPAPLAKHHGIHHGHTLVRTSVFDRVAFSRIYPGEDGQFCRDVLWELGNVNYIPERLSAYRPLLSAETQSTNVDKVTRRVRAIRDQGWRALRP